jgi:DNA polymerase III subunit gamma/tau
LQVLDLNNRCDLNYKTSNNKRLHLELSVMQMCTLGLQAETPQSTPKTILIPPPPPASPASPSGITSKPPAPGPQGVPPSRQADLEKDTVSGKQEQGQATPAPASKNAAGAVKMRDIQNEFNSTTSIRKPVPKTGPGTSPADEDQSLNESATPFTQDELILCWDEFADTLKKDSPHLFSTLKSSRPVVNEEGNIELALGNKVLEDELNLRKTDLMEFLRARLNNYKFQLFTSIAENLKNSKPYTDKEKFDLMAEKNPALRTLKDELDLEIEY